MPTCPQCGSSNVVKNGKTHNGKQNHKCYTCRRQFIEHPQLQTVSPPTIEIVDRLLLERISLAGISRALRISSKWLQNYINHKYMWTAWILEEEPENPGPISLSILQCDEMWSFVGTKKNEQWIWLAMDTSTRKVVAAFVGDRSKKSAKNLWKLLPEAYRKQSIIYTDHWKSYRGVIPKKQLRQVDKTTGQTNMIERLNNTLRQRISRLVRRGLSFSKKLENHIGAIFDFLHHYNASLSG